MYERVWGASFWMRQYRSRESALDIPSSIDRSFVALLSHAFRIGSSQFIILCTFIVIVGYIYIFFVRSHRDEFRFHCLVGWPLRIVGVLSVRKLENLIYLEFNNEVRWTNVSSLTLSLFVNKLAGSLLRKGDFLPLWGAVEPAFAPTTVSLH